MRRRGGGRPAEGKGEAGGAAAATAVSTGKGEGGKEGGGGEKGAGRIQQSPGAGAAAHTMEASRHDRLREWEEQRRAAGFQSLAWGAAEAAVAARQLPGASSVVLSVQTTAPPR